MPRATAPLAGLLALLLAGAAGAVVPDPEAGARFTALAADAFAGSTVNVVANSRHSLFSHGRWQYAAYYDAAGFMVLARRERHSARWETRRSDHRGNVADAHNSISLVVDGEGWLHVSWDHHGNPLNYARSVAPGALELGPRRPMTGTRETRVTYPQFFRLPGGDLLFLHRDGASGRGSLVLKRYHTAGKNWADVQPNLLDGEGRRSPYWGMEVDGADMLHLAWIWRDSPDVATNHDLAYARSRDGGKTWERSDGTAYALPITAAASEYAVRIPAGSNLMNPPQVAADARGRPCLSTYWSPQPGAAPRFHVVRHDGRSWQVLPGPAATPFRLAGTGTKRPPISRAVLLVGTEAGHPSLHLVYRDDARGGRVLAATYSGSEAGNWAIRPLTSGSLGAWEPAADPVAWTEDREIHLLAQPVVQKDGDDRQAAPAPPSVIGVLSWRPGSEPAGR